MPSRIGCRASGVRRGSSEHTHLLRMPSIAGNLRNSTARRTKTRKGRAPPGVLLSVVLHGFSGPPADAARKRVFSCIHRTALQIHASRRSNMDNDIGNDDNGTRTVRTPPARGPRQRRPPLRRGRAFPAAAGNAFSLVIPPSGVPYLPRPGRRMVLPTGGERTGPVLSFKPISSLSQATSNPKSLHSLDETKPHARDAPRRGLSQCFVSGSSDPRVRHEGSRAPFFAHGRGGHPDRNEPRM